ncbi:MAG: RDD family protein [Clostridia bacterium]|nr:RDD family protein [Clostridia bacterium]
MSKREYIFKRGIALYIDAAILTIPHFAIWLLLNMAISNMRGEKGVSALFFLMSFFLIQFSLISLRDIRGTSIGKRLMHLKLVSSDDSESEISPRRRVLRNTTAIIWPIELISVVMTGSRISDRLLGLKIVKSDE